MFQIYKIITILLYPIIFIYLIFRIFKKKENLNSFCQKLFSKSLKIEEKNLIWFHGSSLGEIKSVFPLISELKKKNIILLTSSTLSSKKLFDYKFKNEKKIHHCFLPLDISFLAKKFLKNLTPRLIIFIDSEIWPNLINESKKKSKIILLNARITKRSYNRWSFLPTFANEVFSSIDLCLASSKSSLNFLKKLGVKNTKYFGNLKFYNEKKKSGINKKILKRLNHSKFLCAASTHDGEEELIFKTHKMVKLKHKNLKTIIIPRHIERANSISSLSTRLGLSNKIIYKIGDIKKTNEIFIVNTIGLTEEIFSFCKFVFMGKSTLIEKKNDGGQNPIEASAQGCKVYHGKYVYNFNEIYNFLKKNKFSNIITNEKDLSNILIKDLKTKIKSKNKMIKKIESFSNKIFFKTLTEIERKLET